MRRRGYIPPRYPVTSATRSPSLVRRDIYLRRRDRYKMIETINIVAPHLEQCSGLTSLDRVPLVIHGGIRKSDRPSLTSLHRVPVESQPPVTKESNGRYVPLY